MMTKPTVSDTVKQFFMTTTLHGFKYLCSSYYVDRVVWLLCCCASACCAGVLCAVLWDRFMEMPALLTLWDNLGSNKYLEVKMPSVVVCPSTLNVAEMFIDKLTPNKTATQRIPITLERLFAGKSVAQDQLELLNKLLTKKNTDLSELMMKYTPNCKGHTKKCRYQENVVPCELLFKKELMIWGICCVMRAKKLKNVSNNLLSKTRTTEILELVLQCTQGTTVRGCQFVTAYDGQENIMTNMVMPGNYYMAQLRFITVPGITSSENLVDRGCVADNKYSRTFCMLRCAELWYGCTDPFHPKEDPNKLYLPACTVIQMGLLRNFTHLHSNHKHCNCLPSCKKITAYMTLEANSMNYIQHSIDPFYDKINGTSATVVNLRVNIGHSRVFLLNLTETWLTLLSSLGGIFNMFIGLGLFSALELFYFLLVKLPMAIMSPEIDLAMAYTSRPVHRY